MNIRELTIGAWVKTYDKFGEPYPGKVVAMSHAEAGEYEWYTVIVEGKDESLHRRDSKDVYPLPLTQKIIEKVGLPVPEGFSKHITCVHQYQVYLAMLGADKDKEIQEAIYERPTK